MLPQVLLGEHDYWDSGESSMVSRESLTKKRTLFILSSFIFIKRRLFIFFTISTFIITKIHVTDDIHLEGEDGHLRDHHARGLQQQHCRSGLRSAQDGQKGASVMKKTKIIIFSKQLDWSANENIRPACLPSAGAGDYDQWMSTVTGPVFIFFVGDLIQDGVVDNDNDYHDDKKILRLGNDLVWWLHQQCAPRGRRQGKVTIFKSQFINYSNTTNSCSKRTYSQHYHTHHHHHQHHYHTHHSTAFLVAGDLEL